MPLPPDDELATFCRLPLDGYALPGAPGTWDAHGAIDWTTPVGGRYHVGDDVLGAPGTPISSMAHGYVRLIAERGSPATGNWGWVIVIEHFFRLGHTACSIYGHCVPAPGLAAGQFVPIGARIGTIADYVPVKPDWSNHLHFGVYDGPFRGAQGTYPTWLSGYLPPGSFPGGYLDPYAFCRAHMAPGQLDATPGPGASRPIRSNLPLEGEGIFPSGEEDWFSFEAPAGRKVSLRVVRESGNLVPQLALFAGAAGNPGKKLVGADAGTQYFSASPWRVSINAFPIPAPGTYSLKIRGEGATSGYYRFSKRIYD